jgi:predicted nucleic acid-binding protein
MPAKPFLDTNLWIYAHLNNPQDDRCAKAWTLINQLSRPVISPQVLAEYYNVMLRNGQNDIWIQANLAFMLESCEIQSLTAVIVQRAIRLRNRYGFSYWDCQIVAAALEASCDVLYTEDLQSGQMIDDLLRVLNPI